MKKYELLLREKNKKITPQRLAIIEELHMAGHLSIEELYANIHQKFPTISLATVYKNINSMKDEGIAEEIKIPNGKSKFELKKESHFHLVCNKCLNVFDSNWDFNEQFNNLAKDLKIENFKNIELQSVILSGICPKCQ